jgi:undecaprenyl pyrophosphate phosphatase UppP
VPFLPSGGACFIANILIAFLLAAVVGAVAYRLIKEVLFSPWMVAVSLVVFGILIPVIERVRPARKSRASTGCGCGRRSAARSAASRTAR